MQFGEKLVEIIEKYFVDTNIRIDRDTTNAEFLRLLDIETKVRLNLNWEDAFYFLEDGTYSFQGLDNCVEEDFYVEEIFKEISRKQLYSYANSKKFRLWADNINHYTGRVTQGFSKDSEKYAEFIIEINDEYLKNFNEVSDIMMSRFKIEDIDFEISQPSDIFKLVFMQNSFLGMRDG